MNSHASDPKHIVGSGPNALTAASLILGTQTTPPETYTTFLTNEQFYQQLTTHFFIATGLCVALSTWSTLARETGDLIRNHQAKQATTYLATTITLSLLAYHLGSILSLNS
ncbi:CrcB family protein [Corynebacterium argentoratense]|uniref:CrcB family protein n=1 Tax=Corynebacterium argentoratense TaxID=42817 RepID=UPI004040FFBD